MTSIALPKLPKGKEFEEFVSAYLQSSGLYVERNIIQRDIEEVLELDIISTDYNNTPPTIRLHEIKSGGWGFPDIFKLGGWINYLNISSGLLIVNSSRGNIDFYNTISNRLSVSLVVIDDLEDTSTALHDFGTKENIDQRDIATWRFSYWVERNLLRHLNKRRKSQKDKKSLAALEKHNFEISGGIFFAEDIVERAVKLYEAFRKNNRISARCASEMNGQDFETPLESIPNNIFTKTYYDCEYNDIQISTFIEHKARIALLKAAVDFKLYEKAGLVEKTQKFIKISNTKIPMLAFLPHTFQKGLEEISRHKYFHRYPIFWQWFLWFFGGFLIKDYEEKEFEILSLKTGIPINEIPNAFKAYEILFPLKSGWLMDLPANSNIKVMRLFSVPFMGVGANTRRMYYTKDANFNNLELTGDFTLSDLVKWNNLTVKVLNE